MIILFCPKQKLPICKTDKLANIIFFNFFNLGCLILKRLAQPYCYSDPGMTRHLYLLRHAESAEKQSGQSDKDRSLTPRGLRECVVIGSYLYQQNISLDCILTSTAQRAEDTARFLADAMKMDTERISVVEELYEASSRTFFQFLSGLDDRFNTILIVGHNPVITYVTEYLTQSEIGDMATGGLAAIKFNIHSWKEVSQGNGELENYTHPGILQPD